MNLLGPVRVMSRFACLVAWIGVCWIASLAAAATQVFAPAFSRNARRRISKTWVKYMVRLVGMRIVQVGEVPPRPYFLVGNHISWGDYFLVSHICDASAVLQAEDRKLPFVGRLMAGLEPIFHQRVRNDVETCNRLILDRLQAGSNIVLAPEGTVSPGKVVRYFHAALLETPAKMALPVYYWSVTCRTPEGYPPASKVVLFGPDPYLRGPDGKIPQSEIEGADLIIPLKSNI